MEEGVFPYIWTNCWYISEIEASLFVVWSLKHGQKIFAFKVTFTAFIYLYVLAFGNELRS